MSSTVSSLLERRPCLTRQCAGHSEPDGSLQRTAASTSTHLERVDGVVISRDTPSRLAYVWPLTVGKTWEQSNRQERPVDRTTLDRNSVWTVDTDETITVPAGTFRTMKITWRNKNTGALIYQMWYSPDVKQWIKIREILSNGQRERELMSFKLK